MLFRRRPDQPDLVCFAFADGAWIGYDPVRHAGCHAARRGTAALDARWADHPWRCYRQRQPDRQRRCRGEGFPQGAPAFRRAGGQARPGRRSDGGHGARYRGRARWPRPYSPVGCRHSLDAHGHARWAPRLWLAGARADRPAHDARQYPAPLCRHRCRAHPLGRDRLRLRRVGLVVGERPGSAQVVLDARRTDTASANALVRLSIPLTP
jgi:hypothetical protein